MKIHRKLEVYARPEKAHWGFEWEMVEATDLHSLPAPLETFT